MRNHKPPHHNTLVLTRLSSSDVHATLIFLIRLTACASFSLCCCLTLLRSVSAPQKQTSRTSVGHCNTSLIPLPSTARQSSTHAVSAQWPA